MIRTETAGRLTADHSSFLQSIYGFLSCGHAVCEECASLARQGGICMAHKIARLIDLGAGLRISPLIGCFLGLGIFASVMPSATRFQGGSRMCLKNTVWYGPERTLFRRRESGAEPFEATLELKGQTHYHVCPSAAAITKLEIELESKHEVPRILTARDVAERGS
jgi:hypothetical protein